MDWRAILHNKWMLGGVVVAAGAGAFVLYKRSGGGGSTVPSTGAQASPAYSGSVGGFDSTGTDVAAQLGQFGQSLQNQLNEYQQTLTDTLGGAGGIAGAVTGTGAISVGPSTGDVYDWLKKQGGGLTWTKLRELNPGLDSKLTWRTVPYQTAKSPVFKAPTVVQVR